MQYVLRKAYVRSVGSFQGVYRGDEKVEIPEAAKAVTIEVLKEAVCGCDCKVYWLVPLEGPGERE